MQPALLIFLATLAYVTVAHLPTLRAQNAVTGFTLIDADSDLPVAGFDPIPDMGTVNLADLPSANVNIRVNTTPAGDFGSVQMSLSGATTVNQTENVPPWALAGDSNGNFNPMTLNTGAHTMAATPYDANGGAGGGGAAGTPLSIDFTVIDQPTGDPIVAITAPPNGTTVPEPGNFTISADASDPGGSVTQVEFFEGATTSLGVDTTAPYSVNWNTVGAGTYSLTAVATDDESNTATSAPVSVHVVVPGAGGVVSGELKRWHRISVTFDGPASDESATPNPFTDYRLDVTFEDPAGRQFTVPGYYAADGNAAETGAAAGNKWRVHFMPDRTGQWSYTAGFRTGANVAVDDAVPGVSTSFDGASGLFTVAESDKSGRDFRAPEKGLAEYAGGRYLKFGGGGYFLKGGADSPENFLGYFEFDNTSDNGGAANDLDGTGTITGTAFNYNGDGLHHFEPHAADWQSGDPVWQGTKGKGIVGAVNYLASTGMNSVYFLTMNVNGDGREVFPWTGYAERLRFDCSKLDQWEIVFAQMTAQGVQPYFILQETENDQLLDGGALGVQRKLYFRELIARFAHHPVLAWNLGEENTNTTQQQKDFGSFLHGLDPYDHPVFLHTFPNQRSAVYTPLLGFPDIEGPSIQTDGTISIIHAETKSWIDQSAAASKPWIVWIDEPGNAAVGLAPDSVDPAHDDFRTEALWGSLMAGGGGVEWYFGYSNHNSDLDCEDWRSRANMWDQTRHALEFFQQYLPFAEMEGLDGLTGATDDFCFADPGRVYAIYLPGGGTTNLDLTGESGDFTVRWFDPRNGGGLRTGTVTGVTGGSSVPIGMPPDNPASDWVALVETAKKLLFIRGAERSGGFLEAGNDASRTEHLGDIGNFATNNGNHGWGELSNALRAEGFLLEQLEELLEAGAPGTGQTQGEHLPLEALNLAAYALVVFGSNNAVYDTAAIDALEAYVRGGGAALFISDANFGGDWCDAPDSDQQFLDRFGLIMHQDQGTYQLIRANGDYLAPAHPILAGINAFMGEGVSPGEIPAGAPPAGVERTRLVVAKNQTRLNNGTPGVNNCQGSSRASAGSDASLVIATADAGRVAIHFDRNTFFNLNGAGTDINELDNKQYARNLFGWLANDPPLVDAGPDLATALPAGAALAGSVIDDDCPVPGGVLLGWSVVSGPGVVGLEDPAAAATLATFSLPGDYVLRLRADDGEKVAEDDVLVTVNDSFDAWRGRKFTAAELGDVDISGPGADAEQDGIEVLLEYGLHGEPKLSDSGLLPQVEVSGTEVALIFTKVIHATDLQYLPEWSGDLQAGSWQSGPAFFTEQVLADDGVVQTVRALLNAPLGAFPRVFLRLAVVKN